MNDEPRAGNAGLALVAFAAGVLTVILVVLVF